MLFAWTGLGNVNSSGKIFGAFDSQNWRHVFNMIDWVLPARSTDQNYPSYSRVFWSLHIIIVIIIIITQNKSNLIPLIQGLLCPKPLRYTSEDPDLWCGTHQRDGGHELAKPVVQRCIDRRPRGEAQELGDLILLNRFRVLGSNCSVIAVALLHLVHYLCLNLLTGPRVTPGSVLPSWRQVPVPGPTRWTPATAQPQLHHLAGALLVPFATNSSALGVTQNP